MIERIDKAAADDKVFGIMIHLEDAQLGGGRSTNFAPPFCGGEGRQKSLRRIERGQQPGISTGLRLRMKL